MPKVRLKQLTSRLPCTYLKISMKFKNHQLNQTQIWKTTVWRTQTQLIWCLLQRNILTILTWFNLCHLLIAWDFIFLPEPPEQIKSTQMAPVPAPFAVLLNMCWAIWKLLWCFASRSIGRWTWLCFPSPFLLDGSGGSARNRPQDAWGAARTQAVLASKYRHTV